MKVENYRPAHIEFDVAHDGTNVPENLGVFNDADEAMIFMNKEFFTTNQGVTVARFMDNFEKNEIRKKVNDILENRLPDLEQKAREAVEEYNAAKLNRDNAIGMVNSYTNEAKQLAIEVKRGVVEIKLDEQFTWKLPYKGRYYWFTFIDNSIRLVKITDMSSSEKQELFSQGKVNEEVFDHGKTTAPSGAQE